MGAEFFHADGQKDRRTHRKMYRHDKANSSFSQFRESAEKRRGFSVYEMKYNISDIYRTFWRVIHSLRGTLCAQFI